MVVIENSSADHFGGSRAFSMGCINFAFDSVLKYSFAISILFLSPNMRTIASALLISGVSSAAKSKETLLQNTSEALGEKQSLPLHHCRTELQSRNRTRHLLLCAVCVSSDQYPIAKLNNNHMHAHTQPERQGGNSRRSHRPNSCEGRVSPLGSGGFGPSLSQGQF